MWKDNGEYTMIDYEKEMQEISKPIGERYKKEMFGVEEWIPVEIIKIDPSVQRDLQEFHVQKITRKFDPTAFGRLIVTKREDGNYYCTDGQHRLRALQTLGLSLAPCIVIQLYSLKDEGLNFINVNEQSAKVSNIDKYRIGVSSEIDTWLRVKECVDFVGCRVGTGENAISCVGIISKCINSSKLGTSRQRDMDTMKKTLLILKKLYGTKGITNMLVQGMFVFVKTHIVENPDTTISEVIERLQGTNYKEFSSKANALKESNSGRGKVISYVAYLLFTEYNKGLKKSKIPLRLSI